MTLVNRFVVAITALVQNIAVTILRRTHPKRNHVSIVALTLPQSATIPIALRPFDTDFADVVDAWPALPKAIWQNGENCHAARCKLC